MVRNPFFSRFRVIKIFLFHSDRHSDIQTDQGTSYRQRLKNERYEDKKRDEEDIVEAKTGVHVGKEKENVKITKATGHVRQFSHARLLDLIVRAPSPSIPDKFRC